MTSRSPLLDRIAARKPQPPKTPVSAWVKRAQERKLPAVDRTAA